MSTPAFRTTLLSDVFRGGRVLELIESATGDEVAEVFRCDLSGAMTVSLFRHALPLGEVEELVRRAKVELPPPWSRSLD